MEKQDWEKMIKEVEKLIEKEENHLKFLNENKSKRIDGLSEMIEKCEFMLSHFKQRLVEYCKEYNKFVK